MTNGWYCNNVVDSHASSCLAIHVRDRGDAVLRLAPHSRWGSVVVQCGLTGNTDVSQLGAVLQGPRGQQRLCIYQSTSGPSVPRQPVMGDRALATWLCPSQLNPSAAVALSRVHRRHWTATPMAPTHVFSDVGSYVAHWASILYDISRSESKENSSRTKDDLTISWVEGLQGPVAITSFNEGDKEDLRLGAAVYLERDAVVTVEAIDGGNTAADNKWVATGVVCSIQDSVVSIALHECTDGLRAVDFSVKKGYSVSPRELSLNVDRMQTGLTNFAVDEASGCNFRVIQAILGQLSVPLGARHIRSISRASAGLPMLSQAQEAACDMILTQAVSLVCGPPGTGKTTTVAQIVRLLVHQKEGQVLVTAPSNTAVDNLTRTLCKLGFSVLRYTPSSRIAELSESLPKGVSMESYTEDKSLLQLYSTLQAEVGQLTDVDRREYSSLRRESSRAALRSAAIVVCTCSACGDSFMSVLRFNNVVIDEAGQAIEPECLLPIRLGASRVVLVGDSKQLGPVISAQRALARGAGLSMFSRLEAVGIPSVLLDIQHRMHPSISAFMSQEFYGGNVADGPKVRVEREDVTFPWPDRAHPFFFRHVRDASRPEQHGGRRGTSTYNQLEADAVVECVVALLDGGVLAREIGVIAMYDAQKTLLRTQLLERGVQVDNVDAFQGEERPFMVVSLTRSNDIGRLGHVKDPTRINVSLTRAQHGLIVVGDAVTCSSCPVWANLITYLGNNVVSGATLGELKPFDSKVARPTTALSLALFEQKWVSADQCTSTLSAGQVLSIDSRLILPNRGRRRPPGSYSRFSEVLDKDRVVVDRVRLPAFVEATQPSFRVWPVTKDDPLTPDPIQLFSMGYPHNFRATDRASLVEFDVRYFWMLGGDRERVHRQFESRYPQLVELGVDAVTAYCPTEEVARGSAFVSYLRRYLSHLLEFVSQDASDAQIWCEAVTLSCLDVVHPNRFDDALFFLHDASHSGVARVLAAERELLTLPAIRSRLTISAEQQIRLFQFWWRMRIVGQSDRRSCDLYWTYVHSTRLDSTQRLAALVQSCRLTSGQGLVVWRHFNFVDGSMVALNDPIASRVTRCMVLSEWLPEPPPHATEQQFASPHTAPGSSQPRGYVLHSSQCVTLPLRANRFELLARTPPFTHIHRYRPVSEMKCGWGALECEHTVRDHLGQPVLNPDGSILRRRYMATQRDWYLASLPPAIITAWYDYTRKACFARLASQDKPPLLLQPMGAPGGPAEAGRQLGMDIVLTDLDTFQTHEWFHERAPELYGEHGRHVVVQRGDVRTPGVRLVAETLHPIGRHVWGIWSTPPCVRGSTLAEFTARPEAREDQANPPPGRGDAGDVGARSELLSAEVTHCERRLQLQGTPYLVEVTSTRFRPPAGVVMSQYDESNYGVRMRGQHTVFSSERHPFHSDRILNANGQWIRSITCPGRARPIPPRARAGGGPIPACCNGQTTAGFNNSYFVYDRAALSTPQFYGTHYEHVRTKPRFNNMIPVGVAKPQLAQLGAHGSNAEFHRPFVSHDAACDDLRLAAWSMGLDDLIADVSIPLPPLPVARVLLIAATNDLIPSVLVDDSGYFPSFDVWQYGKFTTEVVSAFCRKYDGVRIFEEHLSLVCDFLNWPRKPLVVFFVGSLSCNDNHFLQEWGGRSATSEQTSNQLFRVRCSAMDTICGGCSTSDFAQCKKPKLWHCVQRAALQRTVSCGLLPEVGLDLSLHCTSPDLTPVVDITQTLLLAAGQLTSGQVVLDEGVSGNARTRHRSHSALNTRASDAFAASIEHSCVFCAEPEQPQQPAVSVMAAEASMVAASETISDMKDNYIRKRTSLLGALPPSKYGLGNQADSIGSSGGPRRPSPISVPAVGLVVRWRDFVVTIARNGGHRSIPMKPSTAYPPITRDGLINSRRNRETNDKTRSNEYLNQAADLTSLIVEYFGGYRFADKVDTLVAVALEHEPHHETWVVGSRDATGRLPSMSVVPTRVELQSYYIRLPDDLDWGELTEQHGPESSHETRAQLRQLSSLHLPTCFQGKQLLVPAEGNDALSFDLYKKPDTSSERPYNIGELGFMTVTQFREHYRSLHLLRVHESVSALMPDAGAIPQLETMDATTVEVAFAYVAEQCGGAVSTLVTSTNETMEVEVMRQRLTEHFKDVGQTADAFESCYENAREWPAIHRIMLDFATARRRYESSRGTMADQVEAKESSEKCLLKLMVTLQAAYLFEVRDQCRVRVDTRFGVPWLELFCTGTVVTDILRQDKTVESRLAWGVYTEVSPGWLLCLRSNLNSPCVWALVVAVHRHDSYTEAARVHGARLFPRLDLESMSDAAIEHHVFSMYQNNQFNVEQAMRYWRITTSPRGCIVCWEIRVLPQHLCIGQPSRVSSPSVSGHRRTVLTRSARLVFSHLARRYIFQRMALLYHTARGSVSQPIQASVRPSRLTLRIGDRYGPRWAVARIAARTIGVFLHHQSVRRRAVTIIQERVRSRLRSLVGSVPVSELPGGDCMDVVDVASGGSSQDVDSLDDSETTSDRPSISMQLFLNILSLVAQWQRVSVVDTLSPHIPASVMGADRTRLIDTLSCLVDKLPSELTDDQHVRLLQTLVSHRSIFDALPGLFAPRPTEFNTEELRFMPFANTVATRIQARARGLFARREQANLVAAARPIVSQADLVSDLLHEVSLNTVGAAAVTAQGGVALPAVQYGELMHISRPTGIQDKELQSQFDFVCRSVPFVNDIEGCPLGSTYIPTQVESCTTVLHMVTQHGSGVDPSPSAWRGIEIADDNKQRLEWFSSCLQQAASLAHPGATLAFPHASEWFPEKEASALRALELWQLQRSSLTEFAKEYPSLRVVVVQRSADVRKQAALRTRRRIMRECAEMQTQFEEEFEEGATQQTRRIGDLLAKSIRDQVLSSIREDGTPSQSMREATVAAASSVDEDLTRAQQAVHDNNQAVIDAYHTKIRDDVKAGLTSLDDIAFARWMNVAVRGGSAKCATVQEQSQAIDTSVRVYGLTVQPQFNGRVGRIAGAVNHQGRVSVALDAVPSVQSATVRFQCKVSDSGVVTCTLPVVPIPVTPALGAETIHVKASRLVKVADGAAPERCL